MQVTSNSSTSFGCIHVNTSRMNKIQKGISNSVAKAVDCLPEYETANLKGFDLYFLPGKSAGTVNIRYMDTNSDCFVRDHSNKILNTVIRSYNPFYYGDEVAKVLKQLCNGVFKRPEFNAKKIAASKTDIAKLKPDYYKDLFDGADDLRKIMSKDSFIDFMAEEHIIRGQKFNCDGNF